MKLIVITEHPYEAALAKDYLLPAFEAKFRARVLLKETVDLPDVTAALFSKAKLVMSMDFGVAQMAVTAGTAAIHLRLPQDDSKGQLWRDVGMPDSILEFTSITGTSLSRHAMAMMDDPQMQSKVMSEALSYIKATEGEAVASIRKSLFD